MAGEWREVKLSNVTDSGRPLFAGADLNPHQMEALLSAQRQS